MSSITQNASENGGITRGSMRLVTIGSNTGRVPSGFSSSLFPLRSTCLDVRNTSHVRMYASTCDEVGRPDTVTRDGRFDKFIPNSVTLLPS